MVIWIGPDLTPWMTGPLQALASDATRVGLLAIEDTITHHFRESHNDAHDESHEETHDEAHDEAHGHDDGTDPHAWLDPENAKIWLRVIAGALSDIDPDNAGTYRENAERAQAELAQLRLEIDSTIGPLKTHSCVTYHDE